MLAGGVALTVWAACSPPGGDRRAEELYPLYCAKCHAADGQGDPLRVPLYPNLDLTRSKLTGNGAHLAIYNRISQGYGPMPGFGHKLSLSEINRLADYSMQLNRKAGKGR